MQIKLSRGYEATIDITDYYKVMQYNWWPLIVPTNVYAGTRARDRLALELFGEFAILNFPNAG